MDEAPPNYQRFFAELKRRRVFRVMAVYGIVAFAIIEAADAIFPRMALPDWTVTLVVWLALFGFPVAIVLAWAFDLTPEGVRRTAEAAPGELTEIIAAQAPKHWSAGLLALVGVTALLAGAWYVGRQSAPATRVDPSAGPALESIAVLPFLNMSDDASNEYFSDGISEELLNLLGKIPGLRVVARTSSFSFKGQNLEIPEIAGRLNMAHILEGSVRKAGNQVRITAQLIDARSDTHLWSETWDRSLDDIFAIQDEIAADVAEQLKVTLLGAAPTVKKTDLEAYALFLQARHLGRQRTTEGFEQSIALYQQVLAIDPEYAAAWAALASVYERQAGDGLRPIDEGFQLANEAVNRALTIDPEYAEAHAQLGRIALSYDNDPADAARHLERALGLDPTNPDIINDAATLARSLGRLDEAIALGNYVIARDPVNSLGHTALGITYSNVGRLDEALASFRTALSLSPGFIGSQYWIGQTLLLRGEPEVALAAFAEERDEEFRVKGTALALHAQDRGAEYESSFSELRERWGEQWPSEVAHVYAWRGCGCGVRVAGQSRGAERGRTGRAIPSAVVHTAARRPTLAGVPRADGHFRSATGGHRVRGSAAAVGERVPPGPAETRRQAGLPESPEGHCREEATFAENK